MMRDLITAFSTDTRDRMTSAGWRKRTGDIYTHDLGDGFHAWVGLNRASKHHPLKINPVVGLRYDPLERLLADIAGAASLTSRSPDRSATSPPATASCNYGSPNRATRNALPTSYANSFRPTACRSPGSTPAQTHY
ncbi:hypothetical protein [Streptomyces albidoflavus]|uniref:hypothetical protein n=1 Tax=Streptomyces albidoflavus TaxID=1886 RepID=UPI00332B5D6E